MTHRNTLSASSLFVLIVLVCAAGCSESTSPVRPSPEVASDQIEAPAPVVEEVSVVQPTVAAASGEIQSSSAPANLTPETPEAPEALEPEVSSASSAPSLELLRLAMAEGVERYEPVGAADQFTTDVRPLFAFMQIVNPGSEDQDVVITYEYENGQIVGPVQLTIPPSTRGYRTFTRTAWVRHPGQWSVTVSTTGGELLGQREFTIGS